MEVVCQKCVDRAAKLGRRRDITVRFVSQKTMVASNVAFGALRTAVPENYFVEGSCRAGATSGANYKDIVVSILCARNSAWASHVTAGCHQFVQLVGLVLARVLSVRAKK